MMTSLEIAEVTGKNHYDLMKAIREMEPAWVKLGQRNFSLSSYKTSQNKEMPMYILSKRECLYIGTKFNDEARGRLVLRWEELEIAARSLEQLSDFEREGLKRANQVEGTKGVRSFLINKFGPAKGLQVFIWWSKASHYGIVGRTTKETKELGKKMGLTSKERQSAKEIVRTIDPASGFGLFVADCGVIAGATSDLAIKMGKVAKDHIVTKELPFKTNKLDAYEPF